MPISATGNSRTHSPPARPAPQGFTLVELMVVIAILAVASAAVVLSLPGGQGEARREATRFAARAGAARDGAVIESRPMRVAVDAGGYRIEARREGQWRALEGRPGRTVAWPERTRVVSEGRIAFDTTGLAEPARLIVERDGAQAVVSVAADGTVRVDG